MEDIYYVLIIIGISFGLVILYIVLRSMKVLGEVPILSGIVDPLIFGSKNVVYQIDDYYNARQGSFGDGLKEDKIGRLIISESLHTGWDADRVRDYNKAKLSLKEGSPNRKATEGKAIHVAVLDISEVERRLNPTQKSHMWGNIRAAVDDGEVVMLEDRGRVNYREMWFKDKTGYNATVCKDNKKYEVVSDHLMGAEQNLRVRGVTSLSNRIRG